MKILKLFSLVIMLSAVVACQSNSQNESESELKYDTLFINDSVGLIRGSDMAIFPEEVLKNEPGVPSLQTDSIIEYDYRYNFVSGHADLHVYYTFDEFGLFEIQIDLYPETGESAKMMAKEIDDHLTAKYGSSKSIGTVKRWTTFGPSNRLVEITLSNETADIGKPFVSLNYLEPLPDEI